MSSNKNIFKPASRWVENQASSLGYMLVRGFHYLALFAIGIAILWSATSEFLIMVDNGVFLIQDILLLFIYLELGAVAGIYFQTFHLPVRYLIYVGITALARVLLEYVNEWHEKDLAEIPYEILVICGCILLLTLSILILRYSSKKFPSSS